MPYSPFLDILETAENPGFLIVPIPYDGTSTYRKGADEGPRALIEASSQVELYDIETDSEPYRDGVRITEKAYDFSSPEAMASSVRDFCGSIWDSGSFPMFLGGEHSVSAGIIESAAARYPDLTVVQFDAHSDLRDEYEKSRYNHACVMARALEVAKIFQVGIRSMDRSENERMDRSRVIFADEIASDAAAEKGPHGKGGWITRMTNAVRGPLYITVDLDVLDPSVMAATGTPEPGGLNWYHLTGALAALFKTNKVIGADIVELCPNGDSAPEFTAAKLAYKIMAYRHAYGENHE